MGTKKVAERLLSEIRGAPGHIAAAPTALSVCLGMSGHVYDQIDEIGCIVELQAQSF